MILIEEVYISYSKVGMFSKDGRCKIFFVDVNGYVRGEGVGMVMLKKLVDVECDGNYIYGVIWGMVENYGGRVNIFILFNLKV